MNSSRNRFNRSWSNIAFIQQIMTQGKEIADNSAVFLDVGFDRLQRRQSMGRDFFCLSNTYEQCLFLTSKFIGIENVQWKGSLQFCFGHIHPRAHCFETLFEVREHLDDHFRLPDSKSKPCHKWSTFNRSTDLFSTCSSVLLRICSSCSMCSLIVCSCPGSVEWLWRTRAAMRRSLTCRRLSARRFRISFFRMSRLASRVNPSIRWFISTWRKCSNHSIRRLNLCSKSWNSDRFFVNVSISELSTRSASVHWISIRLKSTERERHMSHRFERDFTSISALIDVCHLDASPRTSEKDLIQIIACWKKPITSVIVCRRRCNSCRCCVSSRSLFCTQCSMTLSLSLFLSSVSLTWHCWMKWSVSSVDGCCCSVRIDLIKRFISSNARSTSLYRSSNYEKDENRSSWAISRLITGYSEISRTIRENLAGRRAKE